MADDYECGCDYHNRYHCYTASIEDDRHHDPLWVGSGIRAGRVKAERVGVVMFSRTTAADDLSQSVAAIQAYSVRPLCIWLPYAGDYRTK